MTKRIRTFLTVFNVVALLYMGLVATQLAHNTRNPSPQQATINIAPETATEITVPIVTQPIAAIIKHHAKKPVHSQRFASPADQAMTKLLAATEAQVKSVLEDHPDDVELDPILGAIMDDVGILANLSVTDADFDMAYDQFRRDLVSLNIRLMGLNSKQGELIV